MAWVADAHQLCDVACWDGHLMQRPHLLFIAFLLKVGNESLPELVLVCFLVLGFLSSQELLLCLGCQDLLKVDWLFDHLSTRLQVLQGGYRIAAYL